MPSRGLASRYLPAGCLATALVACSSADPPNRAAPPSMTIAQPTAHSDSLPQWLVDSAIGGRQRGYCSDGTAIFGVEKTVVAPLAGCRALTADTLVYFYSHPDGTVNVVTHRFFVSPDRLRDVADSVQRTLIARFGRQTRCRLRPVWDRGVERHIRWRAVGYDIDLLTRGAGDSSSVDARQTPYIAVQIRGGRSSCDTFAAEPLFDGSG